MPALARFLARTISIVAAAAVTVVVVVYPRAIATEMADVPHGWLVCLMLGMSAAYVHGFGFVPQNPVLKYWFSPWIAWPLMALGTYQILY